MTQDAKKSGSGGTPKVINKGKGLVVAPQRPGDRWGSTKGSAKKK